MTSGLSNNDLRLTGKGSVEYKLLILRFIFESGMTPHFTSAMGCCMLDHWAQLTNLFHLTASEPEMIGANQESNQDWIQE
jgi:hypothetical protein